jgi:putative transposase
VTTTFRFVYVLVVMEIETRRILHLNATLHPTAEWTKQQFRECVIGDEGYRFIVHDRDSIYSSEVDSLLRSLGLRVLKTPYRAPQANAFCERLIGSARRECLDFMIPINEGHVRWIMKQWAIHYNKSRPHSSLGPGIPDSHFQKPQLQSKRHCFPKNHRVAVTPILGGLHHEYRLQEIAA